MRKLKIFLIALVALVALFVLGGYALDSEVTLRTQATLAAPPATVFATLESHEGQVQWWTQAMKAHAAEGAPAMEINHVGGPPQGKGMQVHFVHDGAVAEAWEVLESDAPNRIVYEVDFQVFVVTRTLTLTPAGAGTRVTWTDHGRFENPISRYMTLMPADGVIDNFNNALVALDSVTAPRT